MIPEYHYGNGHQPGPLGSRYERVKDGTSVRLASPTPGPLRRPNLYVAEPDALHVKPSPAVQRKKVNPLKGAAKTKDKPTLTAKSVKKTAASAYKLPPANPSASRLSADDFAQAAQELGVEEAVIRAVAYVESGGRTGFDKSGRPKILFEGHYFHKLTGGKYSKDYPAVSYAKWTKDFYGQDQWQRLELAMALDPEAAWQSASWGMFQVMGSNHSGWADVKSFVPAMYESEANHLRSFLAFCEKRKLVGYLQEKEWAKFAAGYNGPGYKKNKYDTKLAQAYEKYQQEEAKPDEK